MVNKGGYLQPFWADLFNHYIFCGFTLPSMGNMALTRESLNGHSTNYNKEKILIGVSIDEIDSSGSSGSG